MISHYLKMALNINYHFSLGYRGNLVIPESQESMTRIEERFGRWNYTGKKIHTCHLIAMKWFSNLLKIMAWGQKLHLTIGLINHVKLCTKAILTLLRNFVLQFLMQKHEACIPPGHKTLQTGICQHIIIKITVCAPVPNTK